MDKNLSYAQPVQKTHSYLTNKEKIRMHGLFGKSTLMMNRIASVIMGLLLAVMLVGCPSSGVVPLDDNPVPINVAVDDSVSCRLT